MRKNYFVLLLIISINSFAQEVFSDDLVDEFPTDLQVIDGYLYTGTWYTQKLLKLDLNDPTSIDEVSGFEFPLWKLGYDEINNDIIGLDLASMSSVDLDQDLLPISRSLMTYTPGFVTGLEIDNNRIYVGIENTIYSYDIALGALSYKLYYTDDDANMISNPRVYKNELYYAQTNAIDTSIFSLYKIDLSDANQEKILVAENLPGFTQSSLLVDEYLYLGFETADVIVRLDLSSTLPLSPAIVLENLDASVIGLANQGSTIYYSTGDHIIYRFKDQLLHVKDLEQDQISFYPNPVEDMIYLNGDDFNELNYTIYNLNGNLIKEGKYANALNVSNLTSGLYFIKLKRNGAIQITKFLKT